MSSRKGRKRKLVKELDEIVLQDSGQIDNPYDLDKSFGTQIDDTDESALDSSNAKVGAMVVSDGRYLSTKVDNSIEFSNHADVASPGSQSQRNPRKHQECEPQTKSKGIYNMN